MTDYLGPLTLGTTGTYQLRSWKTAYNEDGTVTANIEVNVMSTTSDLLAAAVEALVAQLKIGNSYVHAMPGVTNPVVYVVDKAGEFALSDLMSWQVFWQGVQFTLTLREAPAGALQTPYSASAQTLPASVSLATLLGTRPPKLDVTIDDNTGGSNYDMHCIIASLAPTALEDTKWLLLCGLNGQLPAASWTTGATNSTGASMWGNKCITVAQSTYITANVDTSKYPQGKYRLLVRSMVASGVGYVMDSQNQTPVQITRTTQHLTVVGDVDIPNQNSAVGTASNLTLSVRCSGAQTMTVNAFLLIPLSWGYFMWHPTLDTQEIDQLDVGPSGVFMDGVTDYTYLTGGVLEPEVLAAQAVSPFTATPSGSTWPLDWSRTSASIITANSSLFRMAPVGVDHSATAVPQARGVAIVPDEWYEFSWTRNCTSFTSGHAYVGLNILDVDGTQLAWYTFDDCTSAASSSGTAYLKMPKNAAYAGYCFLSGGNATLVANYSNMVFRRCPLRLILVAEDAGGNLASYTHAVTLTVKYLPRYEVAR